MKSKETVTTTQADDTGVQALPVGATASSAGCAFRVWAPFAHRMDVRLVSPEERLVPMQAVGDGYWEASDPSAHPGALYFYRLNGEIDRPDPASRSNPHGVHGPSEVTRADFAWEDAEWRGLPLRDYVIYELHVGAFTEAGAFKAVIPELPYLKRLGITAIELMPVAQFPGGRNWGYDGVLPFAAQSTYGGPDGLRRLVDACHKEDLAVVLDVVYNHIGPEGDYLRDFGPYFTHRNSTPWGEALNFDGEYSDEVRRYFIENALYWVRDCHIDGLRLDAVHAIADNSPITFLEELTAAVHAEGMRLGRNALVFAENADNNARMVRPLDRGGYGMDSQWSEDLHHALHVALTGERDGYYVDYNGVADLAQVYSQGFAFTGQHSPFRKRKHGSPASDLSGERFVVFSQNHDQVGNRMLGERLSTLVPFEKLKLAAGAVLLSPFIPLLFMGEEYGETAPFLYFISHGDPALVEAVRKGRAAEFSVYAWKGQAPDSQSEETFGRSRLNPRLRTSGKHAALLDFYTELLRLRRSTPALATLSRNGVEATATEDPPVLLLRRRTAADEVTVFMNFADTDVTVATPSLGGIWRKTLDSADRRWGGQGGRASDRLAPSARAYVDLAKHDLVLYVKEP